MCVGIVRDFWTAGRPRPSRGSLAPLRLFERGAERGVLWHFPLARTESPSPLPFSRRPKETVFYYATTTKRGLGSIIGPLAFNKHRRRGSIFEIKREAPEAAILRVSAAVTPYTRPR